ncbi:MAG: glycoside hydrolase family 38 C-terminal domain-containing protein [bacterium]
MKAVSRKKTLHVINATHWDREWLLSFVGYRRHLLHHNDRLIELMERDPAFKHYQMDGQSICMEDYLRLRPEMAARLRKLVRAKRIMVGPWYTLPDMPLLHGEAVARNLLVGIAASESLGGAMREGYTACSNGQIAQLPQLYNGFDVRSAVIYKGISDQRAPREFRWQSPDGSEVLTLHLAARYGRTNFYCLLYHEVIANVIHDTPDQNWEYAFTDNWYPYRVDGLMHHDPYSYPCLNSREGWHPQYLRPYLAKLRDTTARGAATSHLIGFNCMDHTPPFPATPKLIAAADKVFSDLRVRDSSLPEYFAALRREAGTNLPVHVGELRDAKAGALDRDVWWATLSARMPLKTANRMAEHMLVDMAEPASVWAWMKGAEYPAASLTEAWKLLLASQAHDSIDGCSLNKVTDDILGRLVDVQTMSEGLIDDACRSLIQPAILPATAKRQTPEPHLVLFNLDTRPRGGFCQMDVDIPGRKAEGNLCLVTDTGTEIQPHVQFLHEGGSSVMGLVGRPMPTHRCRIQFEAPPLAPLSWLTLKVTAAAASTAVVTPPSLIRAGRTLENGFLKAVVRDDGRVDLTHKETGAVYCGLHYFEDVGDVGDPWLFKPVGQPVTTSGPAEIAVVETTPWRATIEVKVRLELPLARPPAAREGTPEKGQVLMTSRLSLTRSGRRLDVETTIDNPCRDHRVRVCFPTGIVTDTTYAGGQFNVDERPTKQPDMSTWIETVDGYPNFGFAGLSDGRCGLAILNLGLPEYFVAGEKSDVLTLTLLRAMQLRRWPEGTGEAQWAGAQHLGRLTVRYALYPHAGGWQQGKLWQAYRDFSRPLVCSEMIGAVRTGKESMVALNAADLEVACLKKAEKNDGLIVRIWNPTGAAQEGKLTLGVPFKSVITTNLNEDPQPEAAVKLRAVGRRTARFTVGAKKIVTLLFRLTPEH